MNHYILKQTDDLNMVPDPYEKHAIHNYRVMK